MQQGRDTASEISSYEARAANEILLCRAPEFDIVSLSEQIILQQTGKTSMQSQYDQQSRPWLN